MNAWTLRVRASRPRPKSPAGTVALPTPRWTLCVLNLARTARERSSQIRARDRAALRTIKELAEKEGQLAGGGPPTRRQLRLLQLATETAPATPANPIVPASPRTRATPVVPPARKDAAPKAAACRGRAAQPRPLSAPAAPKAPAADGVGPGGNELPEGMTVEQALAARELLAEQAKNQLAKMEHIAATDPEAVDPDVLAEQIALAERAAVLNRRAAAKQKLAEQNSQPAAARATIPTTANNLAMVTPLEFVKVPGVERPVMKRPATSYVPVVTNPGPRVTPPRKPGLRRPGCPARRPQVRRRTPPLAGPGPGPCGSSRQGRNGTAGSAATNSAGGVRRETHRRGHPWPRMPPTDWNPWMPLPPGSAGRGGCGCSSSASWPWGSSPSSPASSLIVSGLAR